MKKRVVIAVLFVMFAISVLSSCKSQDCPTYDSSKGFVSALATE